MYRFCIFFLLLLQTYLGAAQEPEKPRISFSGSVRHDILFDSRQTASAREGYFLFYPLEVKRDLNNKDINARPTFNMLAIQSQISLNINETKAFGARVTGLIEADFFGQSNSDVNGFRLRHAYAQMKWEKAELLFGQYWHPLFITDNMPSVVSPNAGAPFQPFSRSPQLRYTYNLGAWRLLGVVTSQRDYASRGPQGDVSIYLRNSGLPEFSLQVHHKTTDPGKKTSWHTGAGAGYKQLVPRLATSTNFKADEKIGGFNATAFVKMTNSRFVLRTAAVYGQNLADLLMLGGYATHDIAPAADGSLQYSNMNNLSLWMSISTTGTKIQAGLFAGYTENLGATRKIKDPKSLASYWYRGENIAYVYRIAPRVSITSGKFRIGSEIEYTVAAYGKSDGTSHNEYGKIVGASEVGNLRLLVSTFYNF